MKESSDMEPAEMTKDEQVRRLLAAAASQLALSRNFVEMAEKHKHNAMLHLEQAESLMEEL